MLFGKLFTNPKMWMNGDADEITMGGVYTCKDVQNVPTGDGALFVFKTENTVKQVFIPVGEEGVVYTRVLGEEWGRVTGTSEETGALIQSAIDKANQAQAKADTVDTRLNNIIVESGTSDAEVVAARTDSSGQTFPTLGVRLDTQFGEIKEDLSVIKITTTITLDMLEKGSWSNGAKSDYRKANRARINAKYYFANPVSISKNGESGTLCAEYYNRKGERTTTVSWTNTILIPQGTVATVSLAVSNSGTPTETSVEDIFSLFTVVDMSPNVVSQWKDMSAPITGLFNTSNIFSSFYTTRISFLDYFVVGESFLQVKCNSGYKFICVLYDNNFNTVSYGAWKTGTQYIDTTNATYARFIMAKDDDTAISPSDGDNITVSYSTNFYPVGIVSYAKDGVNDSGKDYAPKYPRSSIVSYKAAYTQGFRAMLIHVQFTSDGYPVVYHDININDSARNADGSTISGTVSVEGSTLSQLDSYDFGIAFGEQYKGQKITRLDEALSFIKNQGMVFLIEPTKNLTEEQEDIVCERIKQYGLSDMCGYHSYTYNILQRIHQKLPKANIAITFGDGMSDENAINSWADRLASLKGENRVYIYRFFSSPVLSDATLTKISSLGIELMLQALTGEEPSNIVDGVLTTPYTTAVVSQIIPAYIAIRQET